MRPITLWGDMSLALPFGLVLDDFYASLLPLCRSNHNM